MRRILIILAFMDKTGIQTAHFKKYKEGTAKMVKTLKLIDVNPLAGMVK